MHSHSPAHGCLLSLRSRRPSGLFPSSQHSHTGTRLPAGPQLEVMGALENVLRVWLFMTRTPEWGGEMRCGRGRTAGDLRSAHRPEVRTQCLWGSRDPTCSKQYVLHRLVRIFFFFFFLQFIANVQPAWNITCAGEVQAVLSSGAASSGVNRSHPGWEGCLLSTGSKSPLPFREQDLLLQNPELHLLSKKS